MAVSLAAGGTEEEFVDEEAGEAGRIVADDTMLLEKIVEQEFDLELGEPISVHHDGLCPLSTITAGDFRGHRLAVGDNPIDDALADMPLNRAQVFTESVMRGFTGLRHQIGDVDARGLGARNGVGNFRDQEIGNHAGVKRAWAHKDEVGILKCFNRFRQSAHAAWYELDLTDRSAATGDFRFAADTLAIRECGGEMHIGNRGGEDSAADGEHFTGDVNGFGKIPSDMGERGEEQVAEIVADQSAAGVKAVLKQTSEQRFVFGKRDHAVADVAGRQHAIFAAKTAGTAAIVGDGDNRGKVSDGAFAGSLAIRAEDDVLFQSAKQRGKARAAAERDYTQSSGLQRVLASRLFHVRLKFRRTRAGRQSTSVETILYIRPFQDTAIR